MTTPIRYGTRFGCRWGLPHNFTIIKDTKTFKIEKCLLCGERVKYNKGYHMRVDNVKYLRDHVRNYAQEGGSTKRVFAKIYKPNKLVIHI